MKEGLTSASLSMAACTFDPFLRTPHVAPPPSSREARLRLLTEAAEADCERRRPRPVFCSCGIRFSQTDILCAR